MGAIVTLVRLGLAAGLSGAAAGMLLAVALFFARVHQPWFGATSAGLSEFWFLAVFGMTMGILVAALPAFLAGAALWGLGRHRRAARHVFAWSGAGAAVGACLWALFELSFWTPGRAAHFSTADACVFLACLIAGAGGALAFRAAMTLTQFLDE